MNTASGVFLEIQDTRGFNLQGATPPSNVPQPYLTQNVSGFVGTVTRSTAAYQLNGSTKISFQDATIEVAGAVRAGDVWRVVLGTAPADIYEYTVGTLGFPASVIGVADALQSRINTGLGTEGDALVTISSASAFTVTVSVTGAKPESSAVIRGTPADQTETGSLDPNVLLINWTTVEVELGGTPHQGEVWSLTVGGQTQTQTVSLTDSLSDIATGLAGDFDGLSGATDPFSNVAASGSRLTFTFKTAWAGNRTVSAFSVTPQTDVGALTPTQKSLVVLDLSNFVGTNDEVSNWAVALTGTAGFAPTGNGRDARAADLVSDINTEGTYTAVYISSTDTLVIERASGVTAFTATITENYDEVMGTTPPALVLTQSSELGYRLTVGGAVREGQTWTLDLSTVSDPTYDVPVVNGGSNPTLADIRTSLASSLNALTGYTATVVGADIIVQGPASFTMTADVTPAAAAGTAVVRGTPTQSWEMIVTPDLTNYPLSADDVWNLTVGSNTLYYRVPPSGANIAQGFVDLIDDANIANLTATPLGNTIVLRLSGGGLLTVGDTEVIRVQDETEADETPIDPVVPYFVAVQYTINDDTNDTVSAGQFTSEWVPGEKWILTVDGIESSYTVSNSDAPESSNRNLKTIADKLVAKINSNNPDYHAEAILLSGNGKRVRITVLDKDALGVPGTGNGKQDPITFDVKRGGTVRGVFDIDNARVIQTPFYTITPSIELVRVSTGEVLARDWFGIPDALRLGNATTRTAGGIDKGSFTEYDPFIEYNFVIADGDQEFVIRVSSVVTYSSFFFNQQFDNGGVYPGVGYELVVSLPRHERNDNAIELLGTVFTLVDGSGEGRSATVTGYEAEYKEYTLNPHGTWNALPNASSQYEITDLLSTQGFTSPQDYATWLAEAPVTDSYVVVLTNEPTADVILDVVPKPTRTYDADQAFNADAAFGEATELQVRAATRRAIVEFGGTPSAGEDWILTLTGIDAELGVDAILNYVKADSSRDNDFASNLTFRHPVTAGQSVTAVANALRNLINGSSAGYQATLAPGHTIVLGGQAVLNETWNINIGASTFAHTVTVGQTLRDVTAALAAAINADAGDYTVEVRTTKTEGDTLVIAHPPVVDGGAGDEFTPSVFTGASGSFTQAETPQLKITHASQSFYTGFAATPETKGGYSAETTRNANGTFKQLAVELTGFVAQGEVWKLWVNGAEVASYTTGFRDDLAAIARDFAADVAVPAFSDSYDLIQRGRILTISHAAATQTGDVTAVVTITPAAGATPFSTGSAFVRSQIVFTADDGDGEADGGEWNFPQTVTLQAIDDTFVDGGDALVFPAFEERLNEIRGPITIQGGPLVGEERFLNNPFRLPEETNNRQADGQLDDAITNLDGQAVLTDDEAFHFNALLGERPGFDPRMNEFPFEFTFLNGPAIASFLDVKSVSQELLSIADDEPFDVDLGISGISDLTTRVQFSGTPEQANGVVTNANLSWTEATVSLTGTSVQGETWTVTLTKGGTSQSFSYEVTAGNRALSKIVRALATQISATPGYAAEAFVDIIGNSKLRVRTTDAVAFKVQASVGGLGSAAISGRPVQDFTELLDNTKWTVAAFRVFGVSAGETWTLNLTNADGVVDNNSYLVKSGDTFEDITFGLDDQIDEDYLPLISGYTVTFQTEWTSEVTSTVVLSGAPESGEIWTLTLTVAGQPITFSHEVIGDTTLEQIAESLAAKINAHPSPNLSAEANGVALVVINSAANTSGALFQILNSATTIPDAATSANTTSYSTTISLSGTPVVGETWYLQLQIAVSGGSSITRTYVHTVALVDADNEPSTVKTIETLLD
ncbi:MAG TPA: hypothetical protein VK530_06485, partial [Candidatus Acidoferrum sp.]|nr:hypothetical protein [Candidatus Acidoferrum sp.]